MQKRWLMLIDGYQGVRKYAANTLSGFVSGLISYVLPVRNVKDVTEEELKRYNVIAVGEIKTHPILARYKDIGLLDKPNGAEGYSIYVGAAPDEDGGQTIAIAGADERGVLYGCMEFIGVYCGKILNQGDIWGKTFFDYPLQRQLAEWKTSAAPAIPTRAIWTWGYVIYDYRGFFDNMAKLRLNEVVIWNDHAPINAKDVVDYAHALGIKVVWGFSWGWGVECAKAIDEFCSEEGLKKLKQQVVSVYQNEYANTGADGIYFQSFTELNEDMVGGKCIADVVTSLVNDVAGALLERNPALHVQFGLHATSVKTHLDFIKKTDPRVYIVWEDCGAFPFDYSAEETQAFDQTYALTKELLSLRGENEKFGAVIKGMLKLDWGMFEHHDGAFILGERTKAFIKQRQMQKDKLWKVVKGGWLKNAEYARKMLALIAKNGNAPIVEALVEDAMLENNIALPVALYAQMLWTPELSMEEILERAMKNPFVEER